MSRPRSATATAIGREPRYSHEPEALETRGRRARALAAAGHEPLRVVSRRHPHRLRLPVSRGRASPHRALHGAAAPAHFSCSVYNPPWHSVATLALVDGRIAREGPLLNLRQQSRVLPPHPLLFGELDPAGRPQALFLGHRSRRRALERRSLPRPWDNVGTRRTRLLARRLTP